MNLKMITSVTVICLLLATSIESVNASNIKDQNTGSEIKDSYSHLIPFANVYVNSDNINGPWNGTYEHPYQFIQDGIDNASHGDIIYVFSGTYKENVIVNKELTLIGENNQSTIIDGNFSNNTIFVEASSVTINGFTIINSRDSSWKSGILVTQFDGYPAELLTDISIVNCIITNNRCGIKLSIVDGCYISNCIINSNSAHSIYVLYSENIKIDDCKIFDNGKYLNNSWCISGGILMHGKLIYPYRGCKNIEISNCYIHKNVGDAVFIADEFENVEIHNNIISENEDGIYIEGNADGINIHHNIISKNKGFPEYELGGHGVKISSGKMTNLVVHNNVISENGNLAKFSAGICISTKSSIVIKNNMISSNEEYGIYLLYSSGHDILENNFISNRKNVFFVRYTGEQKNIWNGNYWNRPRILPKIIFGKVDTTRMKLPWIECDWHPAQKLYDIITED